MKRSGRTLPPWRTRDRPRDSEIVAPAGDVGDTAGAIEELQQLLTDQLQVLGPDNPYTLTTRNTLAYYRAVAGKPTDAWTSDPDTSRNALAALRRAVRSSAAHPVSATLGPERPPTCLLAQSQYLQLNPVSRRCGFSKAALCAALGDAGIRYVHLRALGNPKANRAGFASGQPAPAREAHRALLRAPAAGGELVQLRELAGAHRVAVMCFEADAARCIARSSLRSWAAGGQVPLPQRPRWQLRQVMGEHGMWHTTDLVQPLRDRGIELSTVQVYRLVTREPVRLNVQVLAALYDIFGCTPDRPATQQRQLGLGLRCSGDCMTTRRPGYRAGPAVCCSAALRVCAGEHGSTASTWPTWSP